MLDKMQLTATRRIMSERTSIDGKPLPAADLAHETSMSLPRMVEGELKGILDSKPPLEVSSWYWKYQEAEDEWLFFADDYEPVNSLKVVRRFGPPLPLVIRGTTMPRGVREAMMRSGLRLFEKSDAGISRVAMDKAIVMKIADEILATTEWMKTND